MRVEPITVIYEQGLLRPIRPLDLPEQTQLQLYFYPPQATSNPFSEFLAEVAAFERLKSELLKTHYGRVVAVYQGQVVAVGDNREEVLIQVDERFGNVPCYIEWVEENIPRRVRFSSVRKAKRA